MTDESTVDHSTVISENNRIREELRTIARSSRRICAKGKNARQRHHKMSAEDLNNTFAIRIFVRRSVFPHMKMKNPGWHEFSVDLRSISMMCCKLTVRMSWVSDEDWWIDDGTLVYSNAKSNLASNCKEGMRKQSECEYCFELIVTNISPLNELEGFIVTSGAGDSMNNKLMIRSVYVDHLYLFVTRYHHNYI